MGINKESVEENKEKGGPAYTWQRSENLSVLASCIHPKQSD